MDWNILLEGLIREGNGILLKGLYCLAVVAVCWILIRIANKFVKRLLFTRLHKNHVVDERKANTMNGLFTSISKYTLYFIAASTILKVLGVADASIVAVAGIGSVAIGFGTQSLVKDVLTGFFILLEDQYGVGDMVTIEGFTGTVEEIGLRTTRLRGASGQVYIIPNGAVNIVTNLCKDYSNAIVDIDIDYHEDMNHVLAVLRDEAEKIASKVDGFQAPPSVLGITALGESAVTVRIVAECAIKENYRIEREMRLMLKNRLDQEQISMPFPQRTVHIAKEG